jgi:hypothetical protein
MNDEETSAFDALKTRIESASAAIDREAALIAEEAQMAMTRAELMTELRSAQAERDMLRLGVTACLAPGSLELDKLGTWREGEWKVRAWTVGLRVNNLTGKAYETAYGFNQPGREAFLTLRWAQR